MVEGFLPTALVGAVGALLAELIRVLPAFREGKPPRGWELVGSLIVVVLGSGVVLFGWTDPQQPFKVAVLGAAFPLLFSAAVGAATSGAERREELSRNRAAAEPAPRSIGDYLSGRF